MAESYFADAKFFEEDVVLKEITPATISSIEKGSVKNTKETHVPPEVSGDDSIKPNNNRKKRISRKLHSHRPSKQMPRQIQQC